MNAKGIGRAVGLVRLLDGNARAALFAQIRRRGVGNRQRRPRARAIGRADETVDDGQAGGRCLQQARRRFQQDRAHAARRLERGIAGHHRDAGGARTLAAGDTVGLAVGNGDAGIVDAERLSADLGDHRLDALADRGDAGDDLDRSVGRHLDADIVERSVAAALDEADCRSADRLAGSTPRRA